MRIRNFFRAVLRRPLHEPRTSPRTLFEALVRGGIEPSQWLQRARQEQTLYCDLSGDHAAALQACFSEEIATTRRIAEDVRGHFFYVLGSGVFNPRDPDRPCREDGYVPIDWYLDPVRNLRFPRNVPYKEWDLYAMRPDNADVKYPWELSRCQHFAVLGQAFRLTGNVAYAKEILDQIDDFMEANPVGFGVNWTCTMDVAIRAANWSIGLALTHACAALPENAWLGAYDALFKHGLFIFDNFENHYEVTSNHYLSNVVGLFFLAHVFHELDQGQQWNAYCRASLEEEISLQILEDGADFESSAPYHRLVLELFLGAARLAQHRGKPLSAAYQDVLRKMACYHYSILRPDGRIPLIGDADDGRLHIFTRYGAWNPQDGLHILAPAALYLGMEEWLQHARVQDLWEATWWGFDVSRHQGGQKPLSPVCSLFPQAGTAVYREGGDYLLALNSIVGTKGFGNHKHNDQLSFELHLGGCPLIIDPGSYVYTSDPEARNRFRSTAYHNTVCVDGQEQNEMNPEWLFRLFDSGTPEHLFFREDETMVEYGGKHVGYQRLEQPLVHKRCLRFLKRERVLLICDRLEGDGEHLLQWYWHFAPGVVVTQDLQGRYLLTTGDEHFVFMHHHTLNPTLTEGWYATSYGVRNLCSVLDLKYDWHMDRGVFMFILGHGNAIQDEVFEISEKLKDCMAEAI